MAELTVYPDVMIPCSLLKKKIPGAFCYEINLVVDDVATEDFVPEITNWDEAKQICPRCSHTYYHARGESA